MPQQLARVRNKRTGAIWKISKQAYELAKNKYELLEFVTDDGKKIQPIATQETKKNVVEVADKPKKRGPKPKNPKVEEHAEA